MRYLLIALCFFIGIDTKAQTNEDISLIKLELYGGDITLVGLRTGGKELPLFYSEKHNQIVCSEEFELYPDSTYYPIVARVRLFKKTPTLFPNNLSMRIDLEYIKNNKGLKKSYEIIFSEYEISNSKILGRDPKEENKFYIETTNSNPDEFLLYENTESGKYRIGYLSKGILSRNLFVRNLVATIKEGVRL